MAVVGAGAAGLMTAICAARLIPDRRIVAFDGAVKPGAKILVSGGGRCNVTNVSVTADRFHGGSRPFIRRVLSAFTERQTIEFFRELGVSLHEEEHGKLFPDSNQARTVLDALLHEVRRRGVGLLAGHRVVNIIRDDDGFTIEVSVRATPSGALHYPGTSNKGRASAPVVESITASHPPRIFRARCVVLATGGRSLPKTGSDGFGYELARRLGHTCVPTTPALVPLVLDGDAHVALSGISQPAQLTIHVEGEKPVRLTGSLLWTHFGVSGPVVLDASRHWHRAVLEGRSVRVELNMMPGLDFTAAEARLLKQIADYPRMSLKSAIAALVPARVADLLITENQLPPQMTLANLARDHRRKIIHALSQRALPIRDSRGYTHAEVTAGGVPLTEVDPATMASRCCPGLYLVGEILDADGVIGGFNFQWAWSSGAVAARGLAAALR